MNWLNKQTGRRQDSNRHWLGMASDQVNAVRRRFSLKACSFRDVYCQMLDVKRLALGSSGGLESRSCVADWRRGRVERRMLISAIRVLGSDFSMAIERALGAVGKADTFPLFARKPAFGIWTSVRS